MTIHPEGCRRLNQSPRIPVGDAEATRIDKPTVLHHRQRGTRRGIVLHHLRHRAIQRLETGDDDSVATLGRSLSMRSRRTSIEPRSPYRCRSGGCRQIDEANRGPKGAFHSGVSYAEPPLAGSGETRVEPAGLPPSRRMPGHVGRSGRHGNCCGRSSGCDSGLAWWNRSYHRQKLPRYGSNCVNLRTLRAGSSMRKWVAAGLMTVLATGCAVPEKVHAPADVQAPESVARARTGPDT